MKALVCFQIEANEKYGAGYRRFDSSFFCFIQCRNSALVCLSSTAITELILHLKWFFLQCFLGSTHWLLILWAQMVLLVCLKLIADSWSIKISNTTSKTRVQVLLKSAVTAQNLSLWLHSRRQKPTASSLQHRRQFPSIWGLKRCPHSSVWALCTPVECSKCSRSSTAWF